MTIWNHYQTPQSPEDALIVLAVALGGVRLFAGSIDLLLELQQELRSPVDTVVSINLVTEITTLEFCQEKL